MKPFVVVCGLPSSGNHYLRDMLVDAGFRSQITHGIEASVEARWASYAKHGPLVAVMPVRDPVCSKASCAYGRTKYWPEKELRPLPYDRDYRTSATMEVLRAAVKHDTPVLMLSFEALVSRPLEVFADVLEWLGMDGSEAHLYAQHALARYPITDPNEKYYADAAV